VRLKIHFFADEKNGSGVQISRARSCAGRFFLSFFDIFVHKVQKFHVNFVHRSRK